MIPMKPVLVFLVEDNLADVWLVEEALKRQSLDYRLEHYSTVEEAVNATRVCGSGTPVPDVMLLDFNLPRGDGRDVLRAASENPKLNLVPKGILSSFLRPEEMDEALQLGAQCFIPKPAGLDEFLNTVGTKVVDVLAAGPPAH
jgi:chemotaxis family two-component system response regulator Rcp1